MIRAARELTLTPLSNSSSGRSIAKIALTLSLKSIAINESSPMSSSASSGPMSVTASSKTAAAICRTWLATTSLTTPMDAPILRRWRMRLRDRGGRWFR